VGAEYDTASLPNLFRHICLFDAYDEPIEMEANGQLFAGGSVKIIAASPTILDFSMYDRYSAQIKVLLANNGVIGLVGAKGSGKGIFIRELKAARVIDIIDSDDRGRVMTLMAVQKMTGEAAIRHYYGLSEADRDAIPSLIETTAILTLETWNRAKSRDGGEIHPTALKRFFLDDFQTKLVPINEILPYSDFIKMMGLYFGKNRRPCVVFAHSLVEILAVMEGQRYRMRPPFDPAQAILTRGKKGASPLIDVLLSLYYQRTELRDLPEIPTAILWRLMVGGS